MTTAEMRAEAQRRREAETDYDESMKDAVSVGEPIPSNVHWCMADAWTIAAELIDRMDRQNDLLGQIVEYLGERAHRARGGDRR